jgi:UDPglucose 6-dehydrogenase
MKLAVYGMGHLGQVFSAVMALYGHDVLALEHPDDVFQAVDEPGLTEILQRRLSLTNSHSLADVADLPLVWVAYDTPIDDRGDAHPEFVLDRIEALFPFLTPGTLVLVSSQLPVGSIAKLEAASNQRGDIGLTFGCLPENLRVGHAIENMRDVDRFIVGLRGVGGLEYTLDQAKIIELLHPIPGRIKFMDIESAEMVKHALNAWLALSVTFANEIAGLARLAGADPNDVARGLLTEARVGPKAYLKPGGPYDGGGHLQRDVDYLRDLATREHQPIPVIGSIALSNAMHKAGKL